MFSDSLNNDTSDSLSLQKTVGLLEESVSLPTPHDAQHTGVGTTQYLRTGSEGIGTSHYPAALTLL